MRQAIRRWIEQRMAPRARLARVGIAALAAAVGLAVVAGLWAVIQVQAQGGPQETQTQGGDASLQRVRDTGDEAPEISFIESPSPTCVKPVQTSGYCYIEWYSLYVEASPSQSVISMTVAIDDKTRAYYSGFFQTSMYVPYDLQPEGFQVYCGAPGSGGQPGLGALHSYTIRARETGGLASANYGSVICPAGIFHLYLPISDK